MSADIFRRIDISRFTPAEQAIYDAMAAVERLPPDERLTNAVILLQKARSHVADYVDGINEIKELHISSSDEQQRILKEAIVALRYALAPFATAFLLLPENMEQYMNVAKHVYKVTAEIIK